MSDFFSLTAPTAQQVFDHVVRGLLAQGAPSLNRSGYCQYRAYDGRKCAAGQALADGEYSEIMEGKCIGAIVLPARLAPHVDILVALQNAHDTNKRAPDFVGAFAAAARHVAGRYKLNTDAVIENKKNPTSTLDGEGK